MYRSQLPRVYELKDKICNSKSLSKAYFQNFESTLRISDDKMRRFLEIEKELSLLNETAWTFLKNEAIPFLCVRDPSRGWHQLIEKLNEAKGYNYLIRIGCGNVMFIPRATKKCVETPDLQGTLNGTTVLCEVKTINISDIEIIRRRKFIVSDEESVLSKGFFNKLDAVLKKASKQLYSYPAPDPIRRIVYLVLNFDDFLGPKEDYFRQIQDYLSLRNSYGIDVLFHDRAGGPDNFVGVAKRQEG